MKKIIFLSIICFLVVGFVLAEGQQESNKGTTGTDNSETNEESGQGNGEGLQVNTGTGTQQQNEGENSQISNQLQIQSRIKTGNYVAENGEQLQVQEQANNRIKLKSGGISAQTSMEMTQEQLQDKTKLEVKLSNGKNAEIKVMPDTASERAIERLGMKVCSEENNCQIELKEVGQGEQVRAAYEVQAQKQARFLGLFKTKMQVQAQVDAETGEVIQSKKPWWAFLASE